MESRVEPVDPPGEERDLTGAVILNRGRGAYRIQGDGSWRRLDAATEALFRAKHEEREEAKRQERAAAQARQVEQMNSAIAEMGGDPR